MATCPQHRRNRWRIGTVKLVGLADLLFIFFTCAIMQNATTRMMDDPGLGWHLRYADQMIEQGGIVYHDTFSFPIEGQKVVMRAWLSDLILRAAHAWGGLNAIALLTCLVLAVTLRCIFRRLVSEGAHWTLAVLAVYLAAKGMSPSFVARPNVFSFLGVWLVSDICQRFHSGNYDKSKLWWLVPIMLLWTNMHGGFLAGLLTIGIAWGVEAFLAVASWDESTKKAAQTRLYWLTWAGAAAGMATLVNPNGLGLHLWSISAITDPFIQTNTTTEWLSPNFKELGWFSIERLILLLPLLAVTCRHKINLTGFVMTVVWLHFALTSRRYSTLWVVVATPTLAELSFQNEWLRTAAAKLRATLSDELKPAFAVDARTTRPQISTAGSWIFAAAMVVLVPWAPDFARHNPTNLPSESLNKFLTLQDGERTFHSINWGGYLTWHGWNQPNRFKTWIDDRIDVHGADQMRRYLKIVNAEPGWESELEATQVELVCIPKDARLTRALKSAVSDWEPIFEDDQLSAFRRHQSPRISAQRECSSQVRLGRIELPTYGLGNRCSIP